MSFDPAQAFSLAGRTAAVTGASRGIGAALAAALAAAGADIIGIATQPPTGEVVEAVEALGRRYTSVGVDLADRAAVTDLAGQLTHVDVLVNNAGIIRRTPAADHSDADWDAVLAIDLDAPFRLAREVGRAMVGRGRGKIIFTASLLSFQGGITVPGYTAAKHAIAGLTKAFANEWAPHGVNVNAIAPGYIATDNNRALRDDPVRSKALLERIPAGRWGSPDDLAGAAVFLASAASDYVNGHVLAVDGGWLAR